MKKHMVVIALLFLVCNVNAMESKQKASVETAMPGIWKIRLGEPEKFTPVSIKKEGARIDALKTLPSIANCPINLKDITFRTDGRGCVIEMPMKANEQFYGLGLRLPSLNVTGCRIKTAVTDNPDLDDGSGHGPVPFYVTTEGYGVFVDTLRVARFYFGNLVKTSHVQDANAQKFVSIEIPAAKGVDIYIFGGPTMLESVQRYNLFSGGGCMPPMWGLGVLYRGYGSYTSEQVIGLAKEIRDAKIPCTIFGLEPGWHSKAYSCSYVWNKEKWPDPNNFLKQMYAMGYQLNLWEHAFVNPLAPFYEQMKPYSGDYIVWKGLVPDFTTKQACEIFASHHEKNFIKAGITGFKLDECDNQPQGCKPWSFPEMSKFPSGLDGEQMHSAFGLLYQQMFADVFRKNNIRTLGQVRASGALASASPFVLYSDAYEHRSYVRGILNGGFSGLLWQPEIRTAGSSTELLRRCQTSVFSPQTVVNAWFLPHPPWYQFNEDKNKNSEPMADSEIIRQKVKEQFELRMSLVPYLYSAFADYHNVGIAPFRALVMDYPSDSNTWNCDDQYMMGISIMAAPIFGNDTKRSVYLPKGKWYCFWTHKIYNGGQKYEIEMPAERIPLFVKDGSLLPLAKPVKYITVDTVFGIEVKAFGESCRDFVLYEDDGVSFDFEKGVQNKLILSWSKENKGSVKTVGNYKGKKYMITDWQAIQDK